MLLVKLFKGLMITAKGAIAGMPEANLTDDPLVLFERWFNDAKKAGLFLPEALSLATASKTGKISNRMVLLKSFDASGFVFYTNYHSQKAQQMADNPQVALLFHWNILQRQIRIEGTVEKISIAQSDDYFQSRPRGSQLAAWASKQSKSVANRKTMEAQFSEIEQQFSDGDIPTPHFWGGYRVIPTKIEFWQGRVNRFHDRIVFTKENGQWKGARLYP